MTMRQQTNERLMRINDRGEIEAGGVRKSREAGIRLKCPVPAT